MKRRRCHLLWLLICSAACRPETRLSEPSSSSAGRSPAASATADTTWDLIYLHGQPVGYQSLELTRQADAQSSYRFGSATSQLVVQRFGQSTQQDIQLRCHDSEDGELLSLESTIGMGAAEQRTVGRRVGDQLHLESRTADSTQRWTLTLPENCGGYFAVEWSLRHRPMSAGEDRQLRALIPILNQVAEIRLQAGQQESVQLPSGAAILQRIDQSMTLPNGQRIVSRLWVDPSGDLLKSEVPTLHQVSVRVDRATAVSAVAGSQLDLGEFSRILLSRPLESPLATRQVRYRIRQRNGDPTRLLPTTSSQSVVAAGPHQAMVTVHAVRPGGTNPSAVTAETPPSPADTAPSALIQSDAPDVVALARQVNPPSGDPWSVATAIERFVFELLTRKDFSTAFATAAEVARSRQGDCTEHAVLTAALCRARGIPARVLVGLVYVTTPPSFSFHMWNEVWIDEVWVPLDATFGLGGIAATHLVLGTSSLDSQEGIAALLPVLEGMGELEIEVMDVEY